MPYTVTKTNGQILLTLADGVLDTSTGLFLVGKNYQNYGELVANNFVRLLENAANDVAPMAPLEGQLWWDTTNKVLNVYSGAQFKSLLGVSISDTAPLASKTGDQWWDTENDQLKSFNGTDWVIVGPAYSKHDGTSGMIPGTALDTALASHRIVKIMSNNAIVGIVSYDAPFTLQSGQTGLTGFTVLKPGINLPVISALPNMGFHGDASNALQLGGADATLYVRKDQNSTILGSVSVANDAGLSVGVGSPLRITNDVLTSTASIASQLVNGHLTLGVAASPTAMTIDGPTGEVTLQNDPTTAKGVVTKQYSDNQNAATIVSSTTYTDNQVSILLDSAPSNLSTLKALATAVGNDPGFALNTQVQLNYKAPLTSPTFLGNPTAVTQPSSDRSTRLATTEHVKDSIENFNQSIATVPPSTNTGALATTAFVHTVLPKGTIVMWSGSATNIPLGWALCNGTNSTPDLQDRFIMAAGTTYPAHTQGGTSQVVATVNPQGGHNHGGQTGGHVLTEAEMPAHSHSYTTKSGQRGNNYWWWWDWWWWNNGENYSWTGEAIAQTGSKGGNQAHKHDIAQEGHHVHTISVNDVRPPFYSLCYIMKITG